MRKLLLAMTLATFAALVSFTGAKAAPAHTPIPQAAIFNTDTLSAVPVHLRSRRHNCRRHGICGGYGPGYGWGGGYGRGRSCRRVRRFCRREWGGGRSYRRCVRRRGCRT